MIARGRDALERDLVDASARLATAESRGDGAAIKLYTDEVDNLLEELVELQPDLRSQLD